MIGSHAHVLQGVERYRGGVIAYSLGNFLFDNLWDRQRLSGIVRLRLARPGGCLARAEFVPVVGTRPDYFPAPATKHAWTEVTGRMRRLSRSRRLGHTAWQLDGTRLMLPGSCAS